MVIGHEHRYLFVEIPLTGSWAIRNELCSFYGGEPILHKHATYSQFQNTADDDTRKYFVFAAVRNPLDEVVSRYFKYKTNHESVFSDSAAPSSLVIEQADLRKYQYVATTGRTFEEYFRSFHRGYYSSMTDLDAGRFDFVLRFERLQDDFSEVLRRLGIKQRRSVPMTNATRGRMAEWESYYTSEVIEQAKRTFGPFMKRWGYQFPIDWGPWQVSWQDDAAYRIKCLARRFYFTYFRYANSTSAKLMRWLRARLLP